MADYNSSTNPSGRPSGFWPSNLKDWLPIVIVVAGLTAGGFGFYAQAQTTAKAVDDSRADIKALQSKNETIMGEVRDLRERANGRLSVIEAIVTRIEKKLDQK